MTTCRSSAAVQFHLPCCLGIPNDAPESYAFAPNVVAQAIEKIAALVNVVVGERAAVLAAAARAAQGWDFAGALHHALSHGCEDFSTLDADLVERAARATAGGAKVTPMITKL